MPHDSYWSHTQVERNGTLYNIYSPVDIHNTVEIIRDGLWLKHKFTQPNAINHDDLNNGGLEVEATAAETPFVV